MKRGHHPLRFGIWDLLRLAQKVETLKSEWRTPPIEMQQRKLSMEEANFGIKK